MQGENRKEAIIIEMALWIEAMRSIGAISGNFAPPPSGEERGKYYFIDDAQRPLAKEGGGGGPVAKPCD